LELYVALVECQETYRHEKKQFESKVSEIQEKRRFLYTLIIFVFLILCVVVAYFIGKSVWGDTSVRSGFAAFGCCFINWCCIAVCVFFLHVPLVFVFSAINERTDGRVKIEWKNEKIELLDSMRSVFWDLEFYPRKREHFEILGMTENEYNDIRENGDKESYEYKMTQRLIYIEEDMREIEDSIRL
jgi:hypothetical protein